jgi:hypothetical protein
MVPCRRTLPALPQTNLSAKPVVAAVGTQNDFIVSEQAGGPTTKNPKNSE